MEQNKLIITIDGPQSTGKGTAASGVLEQANKDTTATLIEAGRGHRALTLYALEHFPGLLDTNPERAAQMASPNLDITPEGWVLDGRLIQDPKSLLYTPEIDQNVFKIGATNAAQNKVDQLSIEMIKQDPSRVLILEGRGKLQLAQEAIFKGYLKATLIGAFYLHANDLEAFFRQEMRNNPGVKSLEDLQLSPQQIRVGLDRVRERNNVDISRAINPLVIPDPGHRVDSSTLINNPTPKDVATELKFTLGQTQTPKSIWLDTSGIRDPKATVEICSRITHNLLVASGVIQSLQPFEH